MPGALITHHASPITSLRLLGGLAASVLLHATILLPALVAVLKRPEAGPEKLLGTFKPEDFRERDEPIRLGIDRSKVSTLTWIGYEEYRQHMAALAETEQAAFRTTTGSPGRGPNASAESLLDALSQWLDTFERAQELPPGMPPSPEGVAVPAGDLLAALQRWLDAASQWPQPRHSPSPATGEPADRGAVSDEESDPTSTIEVPLAMLASGQPLAAQGLNVKPRKPQFTTLIRLTAVPANPLVQISFRSDGVPSKARITESSGDSRVDEAILNSLFRWRAEGEQLKELADDQTITISIRIVLTSRGAP